MRAAVLPSPPPRPHELFVQQYQRNSNELQALVQSIEQSHGGVHALRFTMDYHLQNGFVRDDLDKVQRRAVYDPLHKSRRLIVQYNFGRGLRTLGRGRRKPPSGFRSVNGGCYLDGDNIIWQQGGRELGYEFLIDRVTYIAWPNPFPCQKNHFIVATKRHVPQGWGRNYSSKRLTADLLRIAGRFPGTIVFYNGDKAGASIPDHRHFQLFERWSADGLYPLEEAAVGTGQLRELRIVKDYPATVALVDMTFDHAVLRMADMLDLWRDLCGSSATANLIARQYKDGRYVVYFVPRDQRRQSPPGFDGTVGSLEVLGEVIIPSRAPQQDQAGSEEQTYDSLAGILSWIETPQVREFIDLLGI